MKEKIALFSILANIFLATGKLLVGAISNSGAVFAEGLHSGMDILSSAISYVGIKIAKKPTDPKHPYGYYKFEVLAGLLITIILFLTGCFILWEAWQELRSPSPVAMSYLALGVMLVSAIVNEVMARLKINCGKKEGSVSLLSDGVHSRVDVYSSLVVFVGLFLTQYWVYTDAVLALFIGAYIIKESFSLGKEAADSLLDVSADEEIENEIKDIAQKEEVKIESLKTQKKGSAVTANVEISLPGEISVERATAVSNRLKNQLMEQVEPLQYVTIQINGAGNNIETSYYKPGIGRGFGWQRQIKDTNKPKNATGKGPEGFCVCAKCGYKQAHEPGVPCSSLKCPGCSANLSRE